MEVNVPFIGCVAFGCAVSRTLVPGIWARGWGAILFEGLA